MFPQCFPVSHAGNIVLRCKLCLHYPAGNFNANPSMRALAKILRARASEHSSNFCEQFEQSPNFASTFTWMGPFDTPHIRAATSHIRKYQLQYFISAVKKVYFLYPSTIGGTVPQQPPPPHPPPRHSDSAKQRKLILVLFWHTITAFKIIICPVY